jgi:hypothetical protein
MDFNPGPAASESFQHMFGDRAETSPIGGHAGHSHFGFVNPVNVNAENPGLHVTTEVPGLRQGQTIAVHDFVDNMQF